MGEFSIGMVVWQWAALAMATGLSEVRSCWWKLHALLLISRGRLLG